MSWKSHAKVLKSEACSPHFFGSGLELQIVFEWYGRSGSIGFVLAVPAAMLLLLVAMLVVKVAVVAMGEVEDQ